MTDALVSTASTTPVDPAPAKAAPINISLTIPTMDQRQYSFATFVDRDAPDGDLLSVLDKLDRATKHVRAPAELQKLEDKLEEEKNKLENTQQQYEEWYAQLQIDWEKRGKRGEFELRGGDKINKDRYLKSVEVGKQNLVTIQKMIDDLKAQIGA